MFFTKSKCNVTSGQVSNDGSSSTLNHAERLLSALLCVELIGELQLPLLSLNWVTE